MNTFIQTTILMYPGWCVGWMVIAPLFDARLTPPGVRWVGPFIQKHSRLFLKRKKTFAGVFLYATIGSDVLIELIDASLPQIYPYIVNNEEIFLGFVRMVSLYK